MMYNSIIQCAYQWRFIKYNRALQTLEERVVSYQDESEYLQTLQELLASKKDPEGSHQGVTAESEVTFIWFDLPEAQIESLRASFPHAHLNTLSAAFHKAPPETSTQRALTQNLSQATCYWIEPTGHLSNPIDASTLSLSSILKRFCLRHQLAESNWRTLYHDWIDTQAESIDAFQWAEYLHSPQRDESLLHTNSASLERLGLSLSLFEVTEDLREEWIMSLHSLELLSCLFVPLTGCLMSELLASFGEVQQCTAAQHFITEQIKRAPHHGDHHLLSGLNACDLSIKVCDPLFSDDTYDQREPLLSFATSQREQSIYLMSAAPLEITVSFGLEEQIDLILDPTSLGSRLDLERPLSLSLSFDQTASLIFKQDELISFLKVTSC